MSKEKCADCGKKIFYVETIGGIQHLVRCNHCKKVKYLIRENGDGANANNNTDKQ